MTGSVTGIRRRRTVAGRRETSHLPPDRAFYGQTLSKGGEGRVAGQPSFCRPEGFVGAFRPLIAKAYGTGA